MRPAVKMLMEVKHRNTMADHEAAIGSHVAKQIIDMHHDMYKDDHGHKATKPHEIGTVLHRAWHDARENGGDADQDMHIHHAAHFDSITGHTIAHIEGAYTAHLKKHGHKGLPLEDE